jgi:hypothetical protein
MELVRYIHLNPLFEVRSWNLWRLLDQFRWSGHRALLGLETRAFPAGRGQYGQTFGGSNRSQAQMAYRRFM